MLQVLQLISVVVMTTTIAFGPVVFASSPVMADGVAAAAPSPTPDWPAVFGTLGVSGVLAWYLWYTTSRGNPRTLREFREELAEERAAAKELAAQRGAQITELCKELRNLSDELRRRPCIIGKAE